MDTASGAPQAYPSTPGLYNLTTPADGHTVSYTLRIPAGYEGHTALPVILCLHFGGQPTEFYGGRFLNLIPVPGLGSLTALLVAPTTAQSGWATPIGEAAAFAALAAVEQHLTVDTRRRVVMDYSMGGRGTWHLAATFRPHFVAAIPMAGTPRDIDLDTLRDLPLYVIHSEADQRVPIEDTAKAVERLHAMRAPVEFARLGIFAQPLSCGARHEGGWAKIPMMKGFHHPGGSQQAFLTGLAHLYNFIPYQRRAQHAGQCGVEVEGVRVPTADWFLKLQILTSGGFRYAMTRSTM